MPPTNKKAATQSPSTFSAPSEISASCSPAILSAAKTRREFLRAAAATATTIPFLAVPRKARAQTPFEALQGRARHILILNAAGGLRTAPFFLGAAAHQHNPYGRAPTQGPSEWHPGALLATAPITLTTFTQPTTLTSAADLSGDLTILAGVDHQPTGPAIIDHLEAAHRLATAQTSRGETGLLTIIHQEHAAYRNNTLALPPINIGYSSFAAGLGPLEIRSAEVFRNRSAAAEPARRAQWMYDHQTTRDEIFANRRAPKPGATRSALETRLATQRAARNYGNYLRNPALDLLGAPDADLGGLTNAQLTETLGAATNAWGLETAFALRAFQLGIPAVTITRDVFDTHSDERDSLPEEASALARQISGLHFLLHQLSEPGGTSLWDTTLVFLVSEFNRDNTDPETGFNFGGGSDHRGTPASRNQIWPIFGGPLQTRGRMIGRLDPETLATIDRPAIAIDAVRATILALLGIDPSPYFNAEPLQELFT